MTRRTQSKVRQKIACCWPDVDHEEIMAIFDQYGIEQTERGRERVQLAILKLSAGNRERLADLVATAKRDYRDVLAYAEYPEEISLGFVKTSQLSPDELRSVRKRDKEQYRKWLRG